MKKLILLFSLFFVTGFYASAQISGAQRAAAISELKKRGLSESEVEQRLIANGIDLNKVDPSNAGEIARIQEVTQKIIAELEAEKKAAAQDVATKNQVKNGVLNNAVDALEKEAEDLSNKVEDQLEDQAKKIIEKEAKEFSSESSEDIREAISEGASVQEAIAEELSENAQESSKKAAIYGQHIFRNQSIAIYRNSSDFQPPNPYILGTGDKISVSFWGASQADFSYTIDESGFIKPTGMPRIGLKGITFGKAKALVRNRFAQYYQFRPEEFELTVTTARTITVNIFGEAQSYGSFTLPALNTAFNALVAAGGPSDIGSVRDIRLIRGNQTKKIDVYKYMNDPTTQFDFYLENNDIIYIPTAEKLVTINGAVKRPFTYELLQNEHLAQLIEYAGGLKTNAYQKNIQITRLEGDQETLIDVNLRDLIARNQNFDLKNGDRIMVKVIPETYENYIEINGSVKFPGKYAVQNNMRVSDLLLKGILKEQARTDYAFLQRKNEDRTVRYERIPLEEILKNPSSEKNFVLKKEDRITILSKTNFIERANISISGAVRNPGEFPFDPDRTLKLEDVVLLAAGLEPNANQFAYIQRFDTTNRERRDFIRVNVFKALEDPSSKDNITLEPFDKVIIYANENFTDDTTVNIGGAVRVPKEIPYDSTMRVSDLVYFADGLRPDATEFAYIQRSDLTNRDKKEYIRVNIKEAINNPASGENKLLRPLDNLIVYSNTLYTEKFAINVLGAVRNPGEFQYDPSLTIKDVLTLAGGFKLTAAKNRIEIFRIIINENKPTEKIVSKISMDNNFNVISGGSADMELFPFDKIVVRQVPDFELHQMIVLGGEVNYPGSYALTSKNEKLSSLIERAGGLTDEAFPEGATLTRAENGVGKVIMKLDRVLKGRSKSFDYVLKDGDNISVPKAKDLVSIAGATDVHELYQEKIISNGGKINVAHFRNKRARFYVKKYAGGLSDRGTWKKVTVEYPNGEIKQAKNYGLFTISPKVKPGSEIRVGTKELPKEEEVVAPVPEKEVDWDKALTQVLTVLSGISSMIIAVAAISRFQ